MLKKNIFTLGLMTYFVIAFVLAVAPVSGQQKIVMRIGHGHPVEHLRHQALVKFEQNVEGRTNGRVQVEIYPASQLGTEREMMESMKLGSLESTRGGAYESYSKELLALTLPYLFDNIDQARKILLGEVGDYVGQIGDRSVIISWQHSAGFRHIANNKKPILVPTDMEGMKIRVPPIETSVLTVSAFGASPAPVAWAETYMALKTKVVDGLENAIVHLYTGKSYEVTKYLSLTGHIYHPDPTFVNAKWWNSLPGDIRKIVKECAEESSAWHDEQVLADDRIKLYQMGEYGTLINWIPRENISLFREKSKKVYQHYIEKGIFSAELRNRLSKALGRSL